MKLASGVTYDEGQTIEFQTAGRPHRSDVSFWRGEHTVFHPTDDDLASNSAISHMTRGLPKEPFIGKKNPIVAFGSCFADNVSYYLQDRGFNVSTKKDAVAHISRMGDGIVNTFAVLQQFEWAWEGKTPTQELWHGWKAEAAGYDETIRLATKAIMDKADVFIITLGLSEIWYDDPTGEVFWRAVPISCFDPDRHKFRVATQRENLNNLRAIVAIIGKYRPAATVIFTLSPIPLTATFRDTSALTATEASKANLRSAIDELLLLTYWVHYFPSYEIVRSCFNHQYMEDRRHVHIHVIDFVMALFERYFCGTISDHDVMVAYDNARIKDKMVGELGHWSVPRKSLKYSKAGT